MEAQLESEVLNFVMRNGPSLPLQVSKAIGKDTLYAGAILSQLTSKKIIMLSYTKIGGSPVYYMKGQEEKLSLLYNHLPLREKDAYNLLKEKKILMDKVQDPATRVALRNLKDFAIPFQAKVDGNDEWFWRWRTATDEEIASMFGKKEEQSKIKSTSIVQYKPVQFEEKRIEVQVAEDRQVTVKEPESKKQEIKKTEVKEKHSKKPKADVEDFFSNLVEYIAGQKMEIVEEQIIKKNRDINFVVKVPSNIGKLEYFVVARNKKKINEGDVSLAYHEGQKKKLPVLFLSHGELTKKAENYIESNMKGFVTFKQIK